MAYYYDTEYDLGYDDGWGPIPDFPDLSNHTKSKCCPEKNILDQYGGVWGCVQDYIENEDVINTFRDLHATDFDSDTEFHIGYLNEDLNSFCDGNKVISIWRPTTIDFTDNLAISDHREEFFKCLDVTRDILTDQAYPVVASCAQQDPLLFCQTGETERIVYLVFGFLSVLAIVLALTVYGLLPKQLLNIHGKVVVGNFISCLMFLLFLMTTYSSCWTLWPLPSTVSCQLLGYFGYYSTMAMFSWMLTLSLDLFCTFFKSGWYFTSSRLISYCFLGWGLPLVLLLILLVFDHIENLEILPPPDVGIQSCFLLEESMTIFLHVPIFIFMFINTFLYISTVFYIFRTRNAIKKSVKSNKLRENILVFTKLFLVMGILWGFEIVSLYVRIPLFSLVFGIFNISRGSFMFIIFILKSSVLHGLKKLFKSNPNAEENLSLNRSRWRSKARGRISEASVLHTEL